MLSKGKGDQQFNNIYPTVTLCFLYHVSQDSSIADKIYSLLFSSSSSRSCSGSSPSSEDTGDTVEDRPGGVVITCLIFSKTFTNMKCEETLVIPSIPWICPIIRLTARADTISPLSSLSCPSRSRTGEEVARLHSRLRTRTEEAIMTEED